ncbi:SDR family NAD(P)-dependent oxidoreductase [Dermatobacter hominis]|uniref:SDR family NAD(P)-dependent oxidoreductase n=1 Tax=Dermatobacter hominis TaxID=2884263 RepID=UPI001D102542|nr:SDR family NAD(P)-dependent oxidoreductase [Dermatobacter hominis]UDY37443.1 SDR family oxidoreductase [Dermatobacter hominis]
MFDLTGRTALVTGGGRGVGAGIVRALAGQGAAVAVNDLDTGRATSAAEEVSAAGARAVAAPFDITDAAAVTQGVATAADALGAPFDILVNNAGVPAGMGTVPFRDMDPEEWRPFVDLNLYGSLHCIRAVVDPMVEHGHGRIVQISSGAARTGLAFGVSLYGASKSAIEGFVRHLSQELAPTGVTVNSLALGMLSNVVPDGATDAAVAGLVRSVPVGRLGEPADVGAAVVYLVSDEASWITGQTIGLDGGATTR